MLLDLAFHFRHSNAQQLDMFPACRQHDSRRAGQFIARVLQQLRNLAQGFHLLWQRQAEFREQ